MKTSTLCTACAALTLLAAGLAAIVNPEPSSGTGRWLSPLSAASDAVAAWAVPEEEIAVTRLPLPIQPGVRKVYIQARTKAARQAEREVVDAPAIDAEMMDWVPVVPGQCATPTWIIDENVKKTLEKIEAECEKARESRPSSNARVISVRQRA